jgi:hypothetical protein
MQIFVTVRRMLSAAVLLLGVLAEISSGSTPLTVLDANFAQPKLLDNLNTGTFVEYPSNEPSTITLCSLARSIGV